DGGGIRVSQGNLTLNDVVVIDNIAPTKGGGIANEGSRLTIHRSDISGNHTDLTNGESGGGIHSIDCPSLMITDSTISGNDTRSGGGGIFTNCDTTLTNVTISGNRSEEGGGGGVEDNNARMNLRNVTMTD